MAFFAISRPGLSLLVNLIFIFEELTLTIFFWGLFVFAYYDHKENYTNFNTRN